MAASKQTSASSNHKSQFLLSKIEKTYGHHSYIIVIIASRGLMCSAALLHLWIKATLTFCA